MRPRWIIKRDGELHALLNRQLQCLWQWEHGCWDALLNLDVMTFVWQHNLVIEFYIITLDLNWTGSSSSSSWKTRPWLSGHSQYHSCWWPGDTRRQGISSYVIDLVPPAYASLSTRRGNSSHGKWLSLPQKIYTQMYFFGQIVNWHWFM